jgi:hypothetical protein
MDSKNKLNLPLIFIGFLLIAIGVWIGMKIGKVASICGSGSSVKPFLCSDTASGLMIGVFLIGVILIIVAITKFIASK